MKSVARILGLVALGLTLIPPILNATAGMADGTMKALMVVGVVLWFATAPLWMKAGDH